MAAVFLDFSGTVFWAFTACVALLAIGVAAVKNDIAKAHGIDKAVALTPLCFGISLAAFSAEHLTGDKFLFTLVPRYMPWRTFWVYFVGFALLAAALSIATKRMVRWSGLLLGVMMFLFVAMLYLPGAIRTGGRMPWTIAIRETSFGSAGWVLAGTAMGGKRSGLGGRLIQVGRVGIAIAAIFFGIEHFLHPLGLPGVPLQKQMPTWIPARAFVDYLTGALLLAGGACFLAARKTRPAATYLGAWILLTVAAIYVPVMIGALANPSSAVELEGLNYFADTLLFGGVILSLARAGLR